MIWFMAEAILDMGDLYLAHHGILGQKWGVRRYQRFDGSYTRAGLKRYAASKQKYEDAKKEYKYAKKNNETYAQERIRMKNAKAQMNKDYKHLKQDKLGDQGKELYAEGKRIRPNRKLVKTMTGIGVLATAGAYYFLDSGKSIATRFGNVPLNMLAAGSIAAGSTAITLGTKAVLERDNKKLSAYYSHTSNY